MEKFLKPSQLVERVRVGKLSSVSLLEVGFGLGYNLVVTIFHLWEVDPDLKIHYAAFELSLTSLLWEIQLPAPYGEIYEELKTHLREGKRSFTTIGGGKGAYRAPLWGCEEKGPRPKGGKIQRHLPRRLFAQAQPRALDPRIPREVKGALGSGGLLGHLLDRPPG